MADLTDEYLKKREDVLEVYERPYNPAEPVVCLDEKPISLHDDVRPARPLAPGKLKRPDNEYKRCGTANVFCAVEPKAGKHSTLATPNRSAPQLAQTIETIIASYPTAETIRMIVDSPSRSENQPPGTTRQTATASESTGDSHARRLARGSAINALQETVSRGLKPGLPAPNWNDRDVSGIATAGGFDEGRWDKLRPRVGG